MSRFYRLILLFCCCLSASLGAAHADGLQRERQPLFAQGNAQFLAVDQAFHAYAWHDDERVYVGIRNEPGHYLYRHRLALESRQPGVTLGTLELPPGEFKHDPYLGDVQVFHDQVEISAPLSKIEDTADTRGSIPVTLTFQGCADAGLCYPPNTGRWRPRPARRQRHIPTRPVTPRRRRSNGLPTTRSRHPATTRHSPTRPAPPIASARPRFLPPATRRHSPMPVPTAGSGRCSTRASA
ncbi:protein-disulfide reductase DsbD domain-containing protein [Salinicola acroporae]